MSMNNGTILIIEDDADIREAVRILLGNEKYTIIEAENGSTGLELMTESIDLVILDIMMPGMSGLRTCEEIRKKSNVPILFLTAKAKESDKLIGFMAGGDDYLTKPFSYAELLGRVKALLRRYHQYQGKNAVEGKKVEEYLEMEEIRINQQYNEVQVRGEKIELSNIEYHILLLLMQNPKKIFSAQNLYESVWDEPYFYNCNSTVMVHIRKLRVKIEKSPQEPRYISTVWGKGYRFGRFRSELQRPPAIPCIFVLGYASLQHFCRRLYCSFHCKVPGRPFLIPITYKAVICKKRIIEGWKHSKSLLIKKKFQSWIQTKLQIG